MQLALLFLDLGVGYRVLLIQRFQWGQFLRTQVTKMMFDSEAGIIIVKFIPVAPELIGYHDMITGHPRRATFEIIS